MMKHTADVVVAGGGVMGCSILYNLAARGVTNTLLLERNVLGSGSTGRSQAICRTHYSNPFTAENGLGEPADLPRLSSEAGRTVGVRGDRLLRHGGRG